MELLLPPPLVLLLEPLLLALLVELLLLLLLVLELLVGSAQLPSLWQNRQISFVELANPSLL